MFKDQPEMTAADVVAFVQLLEQHNINVIIDGGWGVDALIGQQTRRHNDLDIALEHKDVPAVRALLEASGYTDVPRDDTRDCNFVMGDEAGHQIDFHSFTFDESHNIIFGVPYPFDSLNGYGAINGFPVNCITPEWMVKFHTGYKLDENDYHDVKVLCEHFGFEIPAEYAEFVKQEADHERSGNVHPLE
jgi:lincosamide nucleotidyltransferase A/C/D/E